MRIPLLLLFLPGGIGARTLFLGNSYMYYNDLDKIYCDVVNSAQPDSPVVAKAVAKPNYWLRQHVADGQPPEGKFTHVILQEQSQTPGLLDDDDELIQSKAACRKLAASACAKGGAKCIVLLQTWGRRDGDPTYPDLFSDFESMQRRLTAGYKELAEEVRAECSADVTVRIAPVGEAFGVIRQSGDDALFRDLYVTEDGAHPALAGSYLAACVLAHTLHGLRPVDIAYVPPMLTESVAEKLRAAAELACAFDQT